MEKKTVQYKRTLRGSVGAGVGALFNGDGRRYYILEHKDASKYHKAGESQKIIIDQAELGRDANCQVRFDDSFMTVSRKHAAIVKEGEQWKLIHLSATNSTLLNGQSVSTERILQNGDEIQLSVGGPRMGFLVPAGKQSLVSSIKMTERLELFRKQALKPYKTAIACMFVLFVVMCGAGGYVMYGLHGTIVDQDKLIAMLSENGEEREKEIEALRVKLDSFNNIKPKTYVRVIDPDERIIGEIEKIKPSVYAITAKVYYEENGKTYDLEGYNATGFITDDGRFVTARHCVEPWLFDQDLNKLYAIAQASEGTHKIWAVLDVENINGETLRLNSNQFHVDPSYDAPCTQQVTVDEYTFNLESKYAFGTERSLGNDWAYCNVQNKGVIHCAPELSSSLKTSTTVHMLGFPKGNGIGDGKSRVEPIYNKLNITRDGLTNARCIMVTEGVDHGNSGGPVFALVKGHLQVIGIVSRGDLKSEHYNHLVPMCNLE